MSLLKAGLSKTMRYIFLGFLINLLLVACENRATPTKKTGKKTSVNLPGETLISQAESGLSSSVYDPISQDMSVPDSQKNAIITAVKDALKEENLFVRERAITENLKKIGNSSALAATVKEKVLQDEKNQNAAFFDQQSQNLAKNLLAQASRKEITPPPSRVKYWEKISSTQWVIGFDIDRFHATAARILVGNTPINFPENTSTLERFWLLSQALEKYLREQVPEHTFEIGPDKIGPFWNSEIIAAMGQGMIGDTLIKAKENNLISLDRATNPNDAKLIYSFVLENKNVLKLRFQSNQTVIDIDDPQDDTKHKPITYLAEVFFDLVTGEIRIERAYIVDGKTIRWSDGP